MQKYDQGSPYGRQVPQPYQLYGAGQGNSPETVPFRLEPDMEYLQSLYPEKMKRIQRYVQETCDKLDYKNSFIYDEYPDRMMIDRVCCTICDKIVCENGECNVDYTHYMEPVSRGSEQVREVEEVEAYEVARIQNLPPWGPPPRPPYPPEPPWGPPPRPPYPGPPRPPYPPMPPWGPPPPPPRPPHGTNWMNDLVKIMFLNEMFNRRCKTGRCY